MEIEPLWRALTKTERAFLVNRPRFLTDKDCCDALGIHISYPPKMRRKPAFVTLEHIIDTYPQRVMMMCLESLLLPVLDMLKEGLGPGVPWSSRLRAGEDIYRMYAELHEALSDKDKQFLIKWGRFEGDNTTIPAARKSIANPYVRRKVEDSQMRTSIRKGQDDGSGDDTELPPLDVPTEGRELGTEIDVSGCWPNVRGDSPAVDGLRGIPETTGQSGPSEASAAGREEDIPLAS